MRDRKAKEQGLLLTVLAAISALLAPVHAQAVTRSDLAEGDLKDAYGSYAPGGDCSKEPRLTIDSSGFSFRALGRTVKPERFEHAVSFMGPSYEGISSVVFPFIASSGNLGPVIMIVNDEEQRGVIRIEADLAPGERQDAFHAAFTSASPFLICGELSAASSAPAAPAAVSGPAPGLDWRNLSAFVGRFPGSSGAEAFDLFDSGAISVELRRILGSRFTGLRERLSVAGALEREGVRYFLSGNAQHQGGVEQAYVLMDSSRQQIQVGLWEGGKLTVYRPASGRLPLPSGLQALVDRSPPETAVALPGTPWEVLPVDGRSPVAYVDAAASPNITSFSVFCEGNRPMIAMLLNKPAAAGAVTLTWNFAGRLVNIAMQSGNREGTYWQAQLSGSQLLTLLMSQRGSAMLRINGQLEGEASLANAPNVLRSTMRGCAAL